MRTRLTALPNAGLDHVPRGIALHAAAERPEPTPSANGKAAWHRPECTELPPDEAEDARQRLLSPEEREEMRQAASGVGHNSKRAQMPKDAGGKAPPWATPSKLSLDEAARANIGPGRHLHQLEAMIEGVFDPRLGTSPLPLQLLAAVVECINGKTGMAHPGGRYWAQRIVNYLSGIPAQYREGALRNAVTAVRQAGYAVSEKRAAQRGGRAIAHFAITRPSPGRSRLALKPGAERSGAWSPWLRSPVG
jgi:hypothetical protein